MREGVTFPRVAGTSAGLTVAAFLAPATVDSLSGVMDPAGLFARPRLGAARDSGDKRGVSLLWRHGAYDDSLVLRWRNGLARPAPRVVAREGLGALEQKILMTHLTRF
jgi:hypothetical protein